MAKKTVEVSHTGRKTLWGSYKTDCGKKFVPGDHRAPKWGEKHTDCPGCKPSGKAGGRHNH